MMSQVEPQTKRVRNYAWLLAGFWTVVIAGSLAWNLVGTRRTTLELARTQARVAHDKDVLYRRWNAEHGGIYVLVTEATLPNPYLDVPERDIIAPSGGVLTLMNPAYMTRQVHELGEKRSGVRGHLTSLNPIRPDNAADLWETEALQAFERGATEISSIQEMDGQEYMRLMRPLVTEESCLRCHAIQGYRVGDVRGGISASIPMGPLRAIAMPHIAAMVLGHAVFWLLGLGGLGVATRYACRRVQERDEAEETLREAHAESKQLLEAMRSALVSVDANDRVIAWNTAAERVFGAEEKETVGRSFDDLPIDWDHAGISRAISQCRDCNAQVRIDDARVTRPDGTNGFLGITLNPVGLNVDGSGYVLLVATDITERKILEGQLAQAQKLDSIGQLAAGIAHEINTPIQYVGDNVRFLSDSIADLLRLVGSYRSIASECDSNAVKTEFVGKAATLEQEVDLPYLEQEMPKAVEQSLDGVRRVSKIVLAMKGFSHPGAAEKMAANINEAIETTITVARNEWKYVAEMVTNLDPSLPPVPCLVGEFNQVILNLIINAAHAIADVVGDGGEGKGTITVSTRGEDGWVEIRIGDTGTGIPEENRSKVFEHFFTTKEVGRGTGQGLSIAYSVITEKHGGTITFETEPGQGTTFVIRLPIEPDTTQPAEAPQHEEAHSLR